MSNIKEMQSVTTEYILGYHNQQLLADDVDLSQEEATKLVYSLPFYRFPSIDFDVKPTSIAGRYWSGDRIYQIAKQTGTICYRSNDSSLFFEDIKNVLTDGFIVKSPKYDATHEFIVGAYGTNQLRTSLPNFSFMMGGCHIPTQPGFIQHVVYENMGRSISLRDYLRRCTVDEFLSQYLQVLYALDEAYKTIDFTHYDLHHENVNVRILEEPISIKYNTENGVEYVHTKTFPCIIGYSYAHFKYNGKDYGVVESNYNIKNQSYPMYDAYKLLMYCMAELKEMRKFDSYVICRKIFEYFNVEDRAKHALINQTSVLYYLPPVKRFEDKSLLGLTEFIRTIHLDFINNIPGVQLCSSEHHLFTDSVQAINQVNRLEEVFMFNRVLPPEQQINPNNELFVSFNQRGQDLVDYIQLILKQFKIYTLHNGSIEALNDPCFTAIYQRYIYTTIDLFNCVDSYRHHLMYIELMSDPRVIPLDYILDENALELLSQIKKMLTADLNWIEETSPGDWWDTELTVYINSMIDQ